MKTVRILFHGYLLLLVALCVNMGESKQPNALQTVAYHQLKEKEGCYHAVIYDDGNKIEVRSFSFTGYTTLNGVLKESDDSVNRLDISQLKEIVVTNRSYMSDRYKNLELIQATVTTSNGKKISDLLIPRQVEISGIEISTQIQKAWNLSKIEKVVIKGPCNLAKEEEVKQQEEPKIKEEPKLNKVHTTIKHIREVEPEKTDFAPSAEPPQKEVKITMPVKDEPITPAPHTTKGIRAALTHLFDAVINVFKAIIGAIASLFGS